MTATVARSSPRTSSFSDRQGRRAGVAPRFSRPAKLATPPRPEKSILTDNKMRHGKPETWRNRHMSITVRRKFASGMMSGAFKRLGPRPNLAFLVAPLALGPAARDRLAARTVGDNCRRLGARPTRPIRTRLLREPFTVRTFRRDARSPCMSAFGRCFALA
jgi:hypothetical protein